MKDLPIDSTDLTWLTGLARALLGEGHAAEDLVQETWVAAMEGPLPENAPRRAWLASVARRLAARRFRGEARRTRREESVARSEVLPDSAELVERAEIAEQVTAAARRLPEPYRRTILLRFLEGRSPEEIAREEGKPADTVRWRVRRGLELLREELVSEHDRDWSSWSVLLTPLARVNGDVGLATAGASGVFSGTVVSLAAMKAKIVLAVVLGCAGLWLAWDLGGGELGATPVAAGVPEVEASPATPVPDLEAEFAEVEGVDRRQVEDAQPLAEAPVPEPEPVELAGRVLDEEGQPVVGATVYLIPSSDDGQGGRTSGPIRARTESDWQGAFRFAQDDLAPDGEQDQGVLELGASANGFLRTVVPDVLEDAPRDGLVVVLERGRTLAGRVVDEFGQPVRGLELLAHSAYAGVNHVSPSQRLLRAQRNELAGASSAYEQCRATTDAGGEVVFTGLRAGELGVLPLDPGWTLEDSQRVEGDDDYVVWTAKQRLGVRVVAFDRFTGQPVERAAATFNFELTFADGEVRDFGQWVGRGAGQASFVLAPELLPGLEERTITRAEFYGTIRSGEGEKVNWMAEPIEGSPDALGVVEVEVVVEPEVAPATAGSLAADDPDAKPGTATLALDVRYEDSTPFEGRLGVRWISAIDPARNDRGEAEAVGIGRYRLEIPSGDWTLEVDDRVSSGSFQPWRSEVRCDPGRELRVFPTLPRGASATITRPEGWGGEWFLHASWRPRGTEEWQGSWGYSTDETTLTLTVLRPAEWRFELRRDTALDSDPLVRTVLLEEGQSKVVDE